ncbi:MAG: diacylglycerol kinase family protein [Solirubrobacterales bacterium]
MSEATATLGRPTAARGIRTKPRMLLIVNPMATTVSDRLKNLVVYALRGRYEVDAIETHSPNHAIELTREAVAAAANSRPDLVVAFGGDGTVNEAANGLAHTDVPLSILPGGCTNVMCRMLGIPIDVVDAAEHLLQLADESVPRRIDLGRANGRYFLFSGGVGMDADVTRWVDERPRAKQRGGGRTFAFAALHTYARDYRGGEARLAVEAGGRRYEGLSTLIQNSDPYTFLGSTPLRACEDISLDNGHLSAMVMSRGKLRDTPGIVRRLFAKDGHLATHPQAVSLTRLDEVRVVPIEGGPAELPVEVDGDYIGEHAGITFEACPASLSVLA